jgi:hypothetical protein
MYFTYVCHSQKNKGDGIDDRLTQQRFSRPGGALGAAQGANFRQLQFEAISAPSNTEGKTPTLPISVLEGPMNATNARTRRFQLQEPLSIWYND